MRKNLFLNILKVGNNEVPMSMKPLVNELDGIGGGTGSRNVGSGNLLLGSMS